MADKTRISWTDASWNPVTGCTKVSPGCAHCYAEAMTLRFKRGPAFLPGVTEIKLHPERLDQPSSWTKPRRIFVNSMSDLFHEDVPDEFIDKLFAVMALEQRHTFQCLSKRPERMLAYFQSDPLSRIAALVYNARYEQGTDSPDISNHGRAGGRHSGPHLAHQETPRTRSGKGGRIRDGGAFESVSTSEGGVSSAAGLPFGDHHNSGSAHSDRSSPPSMDIFQSGNSAGLDNQSQEWNQGRQPPLELGGDDVQPTTPARLGSAQREQESSVGFASSEDRTHRERCSRDETIEDRGDDGQGHRSHLRSEAQGRIGDLSSPNMAACLVWPLPNVWLGVSVENQYWADRRIPMLLDTPAAVRFLSIEPLLKRVDLAEWLPAVNACQTDINSPESQAALSSVIRAAGKLMGPSIDWAICGGESGPRHRPMDADWARLIRDQCVEAGVPFFYKQGSGLRPGGDALLDGRQWRQFPLDGLRDAGPVEMQGRLA